MLKFYIKLYGKKLYIKNDIFLNKVRSLEFSFLMYNSKVPT
jgi:hypothetical protein